MASAHNLISSAELREELERFASIIVKPKGSILFRRGDDPIGAFLVHRGRIGLCFDCESKAFPQRVLGPGAIVGLPASVSGNPYSLTAEVIQDSEFAFVPRRSLVQCLRNDPNFGFEIITLLSSEIFDMRSLLKTKPSDLPARV
ncbi:MAG TPA: cyclic nucleotide-binding domain-containing protein [Terriglobales bacterium]|jgi:CRP-like cAMP-binding protein|nr:cyclic nucleotide-binding domain-containing protein [Terriglobales bacterium]